MGMNKTDDPHCCYRNLLLSRNDAVGFGSATVPVALAGVSPDSSTDLWRSPFGEMSFARRVFGGTPKTAVETTALPKSNCIVPAKDAPGENRPRGMSAKLKVKVDWLSLIWKLSPSLCRVLP